MQTELLRTLLLDFLRQPHAQDDLQWSRCVQGVAALAHERQLSNVVHQRLGNAWLTDDDGARLKHVIWDLILERILTPGTKSPNVSGDGWPHLSLTEHGSKVLKELGPVPYDPDNFLLRLNTEAGGLSTAVQTYLSEALSTFRTGSTLASAVMLGAASEMTFIEICDAIKAAIQDPTAKSKFSEATGPRKKMVERVSQTIRWLESKRTQLPVEWQRDEEVGLIKKIADLIRYRRNDAGHPQDPPASLAREDMYALLVVFRHQLVSLYQLKAWLVGRPSSIS